MMTNTCAESEVLKARLKATWMAGDFGQIAKYSEAAAEQFIARRAIKPGMRVLDVACGTGNLAIPAAKAGAIVTGADIATNLLEQARTRAQRDGVQVQFDEGDAEHLTYPNASFDLIVSQFGAMFAPCPARVAAELVRICRPGGHIAMANWTPRSFIGQLFKVIGAYVPPPPDVPSAMLWGDEATVRERLRDGIAHLQLTPVMASLHYPFSVPETVEFFRRYYGPTQRAFAALPEDEQPGLRHDLETLWAEHNSATDGTTHVEAEYLEVVVVRA
jgi:ubiquinone/menaquinone biosynthesis C-methylase UbiE